MYRTWNKFKTFNRFLTGILCVSVIGMQIPASVFADNWQDTWDAGQWWSTDLTEPYQYEVDPTSIQQNHSERENEIQTAVKVVYEKANGDTASDRQYGGCGVKIAPTDFSAYDYLSFWVYNQGEPLSFRVKLEDTAGNVWESNWAGIELEMKTPEGSM